MIKDLKVLFDCKDFNNYNFLPYLGPRHSANLSRPSGVLAAILDAIRTRTGACTVSLNVAEALRYPTNFATVAG